MRLFVPFMIACVASSAALACVHDDKRPNPVLSNEHRTNAPPPAPPQYLLGDPSGMVTHILPLHGGAQGIVVDRRRVIVARGEPRMATDQAPETIVGAMKLPARFGSGYLFWTENNIYRSEAFDTALIPVARTTDRIDTISFGPKAIMVRTSNGERWGISLPKGERVPLVPLGLVDVVALDEGRALAFDDRGSVFTSLDHGTTWSDATAQVKGKPTRVFIHEEELWLEGEQSDAMRLEPDGHLSWFDKVPEDPAQELRPRDPKWRGADFPLRAAIRSGVAIDDSTALVLENGDLYRIDIRSGDVVSMISGKLPPDSTCQGMQVPGDVLFACTSRSSNASSFVVAHTLSGDGPVIEQTFGQANMTFFASDDGGLAFAGPCNTAAPVGVPTIATVCVRMPGGTWEEKDLSLISTDGGAGPSDVNVARWIPRGDGRVVAVITDPQPGIYDPGTGTLSPVGDELRGLIGRGSTSYYSGRGGSYRIRYSKHSGGVFSLIDSTWSFGANGAIRGTAGNGESFEITEDGKVKPSPYGFEALYSFNLGVGRSKDGRLFQTNDHGITWTEVATPPTGMDPLEMLACSSVGCDFGAFYRLGWQMRPPNVEPQMKSAAAAPSVRRVRGVELTCRPAGPVAQKILPRNDTQDDLGLGAVRLPMATEKNEWLYLRQSTARSIATPWPGVGDSLGSGNETEPAMRMMLSGFSTSRDDNDTLIVNGPTKNINALRRGVSYVPPFDPTGRVVRGGILLSEVIAAAKRAGMTTDEILTSDPTESSTPFIVTSLDPNGPSDIATYDSTSGLVAAFRGERARLAVRPQNPNANTASTPFSGVALPGDETAILEADQDGTASHVYKIGPGGVVDLFDFPLNGATHLANPDALSIGPKNELGIIRTPSGGDPPSPFDPAYLVVQGMPPTQLAAWSTMKFADDPACKAEQGGHRTTIQAIGPWIRTTNPDLKIDDAPMIARVRWTPTRVCVEGFEVKMPPQTITIPSGPNRGGSGSTSTIGTWLVAKGSTFARVSVGEGIEWRQPLECTVASTGP